MNKQIQGLILALLVPATTCAGTINAPYYFNEDCLKEVSIDNNLPRRLEFSCDQSGKCFSSDIFMNLVLNCAVPFGDQVISSTQIKPFLLDKNGFRVAQNFDYS